MAHDRCMRFLMSPLLALCVFACATPVQAPSAPVSPPAAPATAAIQSISFSGSICYGWCPDFTATVASDGAIVFEGRNYAQLMGRHELPSDPALFAALSEIVANGAGWPKGDILGNSPACQMMISDLPEYRVSLVRADGTRQGFAIYLGCGGPEARGASALATRVFQALTAHGVPTEGVPPRAMMQQ
ncbi:MAG: DUF6438 domain-containing protein [Caulobacterales bacterium]|jgi:hypothetical protein